MFTVPTQFAALQTSTLDSFTKVANIHLGSARKLADLQLAAVHEFVADSLISVKSLSGVKGVPSAVDLQAAAKPAVAKTVAYAKGVYAVLAGAGTEIKTIAEAQAAEVSKQVTEAFEKAAEKAPAGSESAVAFFKSALSAATNAVDQVTKSNQQVLATAEANVAAAFAALEKPLVKA
jgi:phasin family protein